MQVYCAREAIGRDPFLLMLGDHSYHPDGPTSCARQLLEAYQRSGTSHVGLRRTPESEIGNFGTATAVWLEPERLPTPRSGRALGRARSARVPAP